MHSLMRILSLTLIVILIQTFLKRIQDLKTDCGLETVLSDADSEFGMLWFWVIHLLMLILRLKQTVIPDTDALSDADSELEAVWSWNR